MSRGKKRQLTPEEQKLWNAVRDTATPMHPKARNAATSELALTRPKKRPVAVDLSPLAQPRKSAKTGSVSVHKPKDVSTELSQSKLNMDGKTFRKMKGGKLKPEGRIDLHGMTLDQAHPVLNQFIFRAYDSGKRLVLVITGKGKERDEGGPIPTRLGVLRHQVPNWLRQSPLAPMILQVTPASQNYGGQGAYFVYLKRRR